MENLSTRRWALHQICWLVPACKLINSQSRPQSDPKLAFSLRFIFTQMSASLKKPQLLISFELHRKLNLGEKRQDFSEPKKRFSFLSRRNQLEIYFHK